VGKKITEKIKNKIMPYKVKGQCIYKKDTGKKVGCTKGSVDKYLAALHANVDESSLNENLNYVDMFNKDFFLVRIPFLSDYKFFDRKNGIEAQRVIFHENVDKLYKGDIIKFKQFNVSSEFIFYTHRVNDATFYNFIIKNQFHPMLDDNTLNSLEEKVALLELQKSDLVKQGQEKDSAINKLQKALGNCEKNVRLCNDELDLRNEEIKILKKEIFRQKVKKWISVGGNVVLAIITTVIIIKS
jgi:hypothetical protein